VFLADPVIARATLLYGLPVGGSRTQTTVNSFTWPLRDICIAIRKARWYEHFLWSELLPVSDRFSDHIHSQLFQEQTTSLWFAFVEIRIDREKHYGSILCCNVQKILEEYHRPTTGFTLAGIGSDKLVNIIHSRFCSVVVKNIFRPFIFTFIIYFSVVMLCGHENDILPTFRNVRCQRLFTEKSKRTWIDTSLFGIEKRRWKKASIVSNCSTVCYLSSQQSISLSEQLEEIICSAASTSTVPRFYHLEHFTLVAWSTSGVRPCLLVYSSKLQIYDVSTPQQTHTLRPYFPG